MSLKNEILNVLSLFESDAMTANELFESCKSEADIKNISTALSVMFKEGLVNRKSVTSNGVFRYGYWKKENLKETSKEISKETKPEEVPTLIKTLKTAPIELTEPAAKVEPAEPTKEDLIVMWMNGAEIEQGIRGHNNWFYADYPEWKNSNYVFRLRPQFYEVHAEISTEDGDEVSIAHRNVTPNVKFVFDKASKLISVELLA